MVDKDWVVTNIRNEASPLIGMEPLFRTMSRDMCSALELEIETEFMVLFKDGTATMADIESDCIAFGNATVSSLTKPDFAAWLLKGIERECVELTRYANDCIAATTNVFSSKELSNFVERGFLQLERFLRFNHIINASDFHHNCLTSFLYERLKNYDLSESGLSIGAAYSALTTPKREVLIQKEERDLLEIIRLTETNSTKKARRALDLHARCYFWIEYEQQGQQLDVSDFEQRMLAKKSDIVDALSALNDLETRRAATQRERDHAYQEIDLSPEDKYMFEVSSDLVFWKMHLREIKVQFFCAMEKVLCEVANRNHLSLGQLRFLTQQELSDLMDGEISPSSTELNSRNEQSLFAFKNGMTTVIVGDDATSIFLDAVGDDSDVQATQLSGTCGYPGMVTGIVRRVLTVNDNEKFLTGEILTAYMTDVGVVPAMRRAKAIVTDIGGVTCHAAIIAREFKIPCLIGTKSVSQDFNNGDIVEVDADAGNISLIQRASCKSANEETSLSNRFDAAFTKFRLKPNLFEKDKVRPYGLCDLGNNLTSSVGGKASNLSILVNRGHRVPNGFALTTDCYWHFIHSNNLLDPVNEILASIVTESDANWAANQIVLLFANSDFDPSLERQVLHSLNNLNTDLFAIRSSAPQEDSMHASWAGQFDSFLNTDCLRAIDKIKSCWASAFSARSLSYRRHLDSDPTNFEMAVLVQEMVDAEVSGTLFSVDPVTHEKKHVIIECCKGLGENLVSGSVNPDHYKVDREHFKIIEFRPSSGSDSRKIEAELLSELTERSLDIERSIGCAVDIEWSISKNLVHILQARPITA